MNKKGVILLLGIAAIAAPLGFMVGGSATPVVGVALPAIFGLVITAIGLFQPTWPSKEHAELVVASSTNTDIKNYLDDIKAKQDSAPLRIGLALIVFGVTYSACAILGTKARVEQWFAPSISKPPTFPWASSKMKPETASSAIKWLELQRDLRSAGYTDSQISALFEIQVSEWIEKQKQKARLDELAEKQVSLCQQSPAQNSSVVEPTTPDLYWRDVSKSLHILPQGSQTNNTSPFAIPGEPSNNPFAHSALPRY